jgi:hypothetical protein
MMICIVCLSKSDKQRYYGELENGTVSGDDQYELEVKIKDGVAMGI